jgi:hypothetical protein
MAFVPEALLRSALSDGVQGKSLVDVSAHGDAGVLCSKSWFQKNVFFLRDTNNLRNNMRLIIVAWVCWGGAWAGSMEISG